MLPFFLSVSGLRQLRTSQNQKRFFDYRWTPWHLWLPLRSFCAALRSLCAAFWSPPLWRLVAPRWSRSLLHWSGSDRRQTQRAFVCLLCGISARAAPCTARSRRLRCGCCRWLQFLWASPPYTLQYPMAHMRSGGKHYLLLNHYQITLRRR